MIIIELDYKVLNNNEFICAGHLNEQC